LEDANTDGLCRPEPQLNELRKVARRNRNFTHFDGITKAVVSIASNQIQTITFFENPLSDEQGTENMLADAWKAAELKCRVDEERTSVIDLYMGKMPEILQRTLTNPS